MQAERKYRGRLLAGDAPSFLEDMNAEVINNRNHGAQVVPKYLVRKIKITAVIFIHRRDRDTFTDHRTRMRGRISNPFQRIGYIKVFRKLTMFCAQDGR